MNMKHSMKVFAQVLALLLLLTAAAACSRGGAVAPEETPSMQEVSWDEVLSVTSDPIDLPVSEESETESDTAGIRALNCLDGAGTVTVLLSGPSGEAVARVETAQSGGQKGCFLYRIDPASDTVLSKTGGETDPGLPIGIRENGEIVTFDQENQSIVRYDTGLQPVSRLPVKGFQAFYSRNDDSVYLICDGDLVRFSFDGEEQTLLSFRGHRNVEDVNVDARAALVLDGAVSNQATEAYMVYSFEGEKLFSREADHGPYLFSDGLLCAVDYEGVPEDETGEKGALLVYDPHNGWSVRASVISKMKSYKAIDASPFVCCTEHVSEQDGSERTVVDLLNIRTGEMIGCGIFGGYLETAAACDRSNGTILLSVSSEKSISFSEIDPETLAVSDVLRETQALPVPEPEEIRLAEHLSQAGALADEIENKYHVRVLLSDEVGQVRPSEYEYESTSAMDPQEETLCVTRALETLDNALSLYPEGFFDFFRNDDGQAGVRFLLVNDLVGGETSSFSAAGYAYSSGAWYNIAIKADELTEVVTHHEIWHTVEDLAGVEGHAVGYYDWMPLNPEGYEYVVDKESYQENAYSEYLLGSAANDNVYFYRTYSSVNDSEDRATVIEALFSYGSVSDGYRVIQRYPHLFAKVQYLGDLIRPVFGYVYWEEMMR